MGNAFLSSCSLQNGFSKSISYLKFCLEVPYQPVSDTNRKPKEAPKPVMMQTRSITVLRTQTEDDFKKIFRLEGKLGEGSFGTVFLCVEKATGKEYACKSVEKRKLIRGEDVENLRNEINIMHYLAGHPNVASIKGSYEDSEAVHIVMELCGGGELFDRIKQRRHYEERDAARLTRTIAAAVDSFHSLGVMHRDLKPENFLFLNQEEDSPLKVIDFGLSTFFSPGERFSTPVGSIYYAAPEVLQKKCGPEADIWSAGVILYILLSGVFPFRIETNEARHKQVLHGDLDFSSGPWPGVSETAKDLIRRMLDPDPATRITAKEILSHPWFQVCGVESLEPQ